MLRNLSTGVLGKKLYKVNLKRFENGFSLLLNGKQHETPSGIPIVLSSHSLAIAIACEWNAQIDFIRPHMMPLVYFM